jgi:flagellar basal body-associated protein FliL
MNPKTRTILIVVLILLVVMIVALVAYNASKKGTAGPTPEQPPLPPAEDQILKSQRMGRYSLGEFVATTRDEDLHYIKVEVELGFYGKLDKELDERKGELRDAVTTILMKMTVARAKEDYIDHFLHTDIVKKLNEILGTSESESRIVKVFIPVFLIN